MNQPTKTESTTTATPQSSSFSKSQHNPYARMSQRRAIACTICAKAKTKCDKAVPSCSRCTAKGLQCEPRSTRRTSDSNYRNTKKHLVSPKRYPTTNSMPTMSRHSSPRSVPSSDRHQLVRAVSQIDYQTAAKLGQQHPGISGYPILTPLQTYSPQIIDECHSYSSSPEQNMTAFTQPMEKNSFLSSGRLTPQTPESFVYHEPLSIVDQFDHHPNMQPWSNDGYEPIGLGLDGGIPGLMPGDMWSTPELESTTPMGICDSPGTMNAWTAPALSMSPPQMSNGLPDGLPPHSRAVPSLSISECSVQDFESPNNGQEEWPAFRPNGQMPIVKPTTSAAFMEESSKSKNPPIWEDVMIPRSTF